MPTIAQLASQVNKAPKLVINEVTKAYPEAVWGLNSEVPQEFIDSLTKHAKEYDGTPTPSTSSDTKAISGGALTITESADLILSDAGFEYGIMAASEEIQASIMYKQGRMAAIEMINAYQSAKHNALNGFFQAELLESKDQLIALEKRGEALQEAATKKQQTAQALTSQMSEMRARISALPKL